MPNPGVIPTLLTTLTGYPGSTTVNNFYSLPSLLANVDEYFRGLIAHPYSGDLLVGEAPGWAGCALTGIPFTSEHVISSSPHPFLRGLHSRLAIGGNQSEPTATMVWDSIGRSSRLPAFWNAFPFHPHYSGSYRNRPPTRMEKAFGATVLGIVIHILTPGRIFAVGRTAQCTLRTHLSLAAPYIRHPSNGGRPGFLSGLAVYNVV